jgi:lysine-specific demethylase 8
MPPHEIRRIRIPSPDEFFREYVFRRRPVVITDLFEGQEISRIATLEDAARTWSAMRIELQEEYASAEASGASSSPTVMPFGEYLELTSSDPSTRLCCTEYDTPARVLASFRLPPACRVTSPSEDEVFGLPRKYGDYDLTTAVFIANRGNVGHLHFDGDQREVFLHQVYGRKRVILFPPASAIHLRTLDGPYTRPSLSGLYLESMSPDEKASIVERAGGYHTVLAPGETIYIPMLMWHHVEYLDDAMSFNLRFGRTRFGRFLSLDNFHRDPYIQNVASKLVGPEETLRAFEATVEEIKMEYTRTVPDMRARVRDMRALFRGLCAKMCPEAAAERLCPPEREEEQISRIVDSRDMRGGLKYADPALIAGTRPVGRIASRQREIIVEGMNRCGYSPEVGQAVLFNRVGKAAVDELTRAEAAQIIAYLATPGAAW